MKLYLNILIGAVLFYLFIQVGWITVGDYNPYVASLLASIIFFVVGWFLGLAFVLLVVASCGIGCVLLPLYYVGLGLLGFAGVHFLLPDMVAVGDTVHLIIMGLLIVLVRIPSVSPSSSSTTTLSNR